jgi:hypothetical protein
MTDWLPWGLVLMVWVFSTLGLAMRQIGRTPVGTVPDLRMPRRALFIGAAATFLVNLVYIVFEERWIWY